MKKFVATTEYNVGTNLKRVCDELQKTIKITKLAKYMGYTTTRQLHNTINGNASLSQKAIETMVINLNISPTYLFTGTGDMFLFQTKEPVSCIEFKYITSTL